uniref:Uncharacterized protein n=1 Tax=Oryza barthii TaxID=65489 RepID=A0A0D3FL82_9ORYZ
MSTNVLWGKEAQKEGEPLKVAEKAAASNHHQSSIIKLLANSAPTNISQGKEAPKEGETLNVCGQGHPSKGDED